MKKAKPKRVAARKTWTINPKTRVKESKGAYRRPKEKEKIVKLYEKEEFHT